MTFGAPQVENAELEANSASLKEEVERVKEKLSEQLVQVRNLEQRLGPMQEFSRPAPHALACRSTGLSMLHPAWAAEVEEFISKKHQMNCAPDTGRDYPPISLRFEAASAEIPCALDRSTTFEVTREDSLLAAKRLLTGDSISESGRPLVLNMANADHMGGAFLSGSDG